MGDVRTVTYYGGVRGVLIFFAGEDSLVDALIISIDAVPGGDGTI